jgi:hypothetical protein
MEPKLSDEQSIILNFIHNTVFVIDPSGPVPGQRVLQRFGFANTFEGRPLNIVN